MEARKPTNVTFRRSSHRKSKHGCKTCRRRHIRCDEARPHCRNCTYHGSTCDYGLQLAGADNKDNSAPTVIRSVHNRNVPIQDPETRLFPQPSLQILPVNEHRLLYHISSIVTQIEILDMGKYTTWMSSLPDILATAFSSECAMQAILAWSATHIDWTRGEDGTDNIAQSYRSKAIAGLRHAIPNFTEENSDAILGTSILLSWQATDFASWCTLMNGTATVINAMLPWQLRSNLTQIIAGHISFSTSLMQGSMPASQPRYQEELASLKYIHYNLQKIVPITRNRPEESAILAFLMSFVQSMQTNLPVSSGEARCILLRPLRDRLFWLPVNLLQRTHADPVSLVVLAQLYAVHLTVLPVFVTSGSVFFRSLSLGPIDAICTELRRLHACSSGEESAALPSMSMLDFPIEAVKTFKLRLGKKDDVESVPLPLRGITFGMETLPSIPVC